MRHVVRLHLKTLLMREQNENESQHFCREGTYWLRGIALWDFTSSATFKVGANIITAVVIYLFVLFCLLTPPALSMLGTTVGLYGIPWCKKSLLLTVLMSVIGASMGVLDTGKWPLGAVLPSLNWLGTRSWQFSWAWRTSFYTSGIKRRELFYLARIPAGLFCSWGFSVRVPVTDSFGVCVFSRSGEMGISCCLGKIDVQYSGQLGA